MIMAIRNFVAAVTHPHAREKPPRHVCTWLINVNLDLNRTNPRLHYRKPIGGEKMDRGEPVV